MFCVHVVVRVMERGREGFRVARLMQDDDAPQCPAVPPHSPY
jgi:hypothetical protein